MAYIHVMMLHIGETLCLPHVSHFYTLITLANVSKVLWCFVDYFKEPVFEKTWVFVNWRWASASRRTTAEGRVPPRGKMDFALCPGPSRWTSIRQQNDTDQHWPTSKWWKSSLLISCITYLLLSQKICCFSWESTYFTENNTCLSIKLIQMFSSNQICYQKILHNSSVTPMRNVVRVFPFVLFVHL